MSQNICFCSFIKSKIEQVYIYLKFLNITIIINTTIDPKSNIIKTPVSSKFYSI